MRPDLATQITYPDGTVWNFGWQFETIITGITGACDPYSGQCYPVPVYSTFARLASISNSTGYQINVIYGSNLAYDYGEWARVSGAWAINKAVEYCVGSPCTNVWPQVSYGAAGDDPHRTSSMTDPEGRTTNYTYVQTTSHGVKLTGIRAPGASTDTLTFGYDGNGRVASVSAAGSTWNYTYGSNYTTVTDPLSQARTVYFNGSKQITSVTAGGKTTAYQYCTGVAGCPTGLLKTVTAPEGNTVSYAYDARGNVTSTTYARKPGSTTTPATIVTSAAYPASCASGTQKTCNKPTSTTDARGQVTNYQWNATHGGLDWAKAPADASGVRPETRYTYTAKQARYLTGPSTWTVGANVYVPTEASSCRVGASCNGTVNEREAVVAYPANTVANNLQPTSVTTRAGDGTLAATTTVTYDNYGRTITADGPLAGPADTSMVRYSLAGQVIGEVAPDPDDAGTSKYPATRYSYDVAGRLYQTETGMVNGLSDTDWANFTPTGSTLTMFDAHRRPVRQRVRGGGSDHQIVDTVYDAAGRVTCTIVRMDPATWGTVLSNCPTTAAAGPNGPDRITYNTYDALGRVTKVTSGYGTGVAADDVTTTFTSNGQVATVKDAEGNLTTYEYDGYDRLVKTRFPHPSTAGTSSTTDYEYVGYDAAGNVISFRTRRGETLGLTYDNLGRLITKAVPERSGLAATHTRDVYFGYDLFGGMTYARFDSAGGEGVTNAFNALGQLTSTTTDLDGASRALSYQYDLAGNFTRLTYPDGNYLLYTRQPSGAFFNAKINASGLFYPVLDTAGRPYRLYRNDITAGVWTNQYTQFGYDAISRVSSMTTVLPGTSHDSTTTFTYNPAGQIASVTRDNDAYAWTGHAAVDRGYTANGLNQYTAVAGTGFGYDANANLTSDGTNTYVYDVENRLVTRSGGASATLRYDPLGRLYEVTGASGTRRFLYDGSDLVAEYNPSGTLLRRYIHGPGAGDDPLVWFEGSGVTSSARRYLYADERGSIVAVTDSSGTVLNVNTYDEYGIPGSGNAGTFQYTGQAWLPELGMYYYKARMYSPTLGRFMQTDPIGYGDGMNMYAYVHSDPVNGVDPSGLNQCQFQAMGGGIPAGSVPDDVIRVIAERIRACEASPIPGVQSIDCSYGACNDILNPRQTTGSPGGGGNGTSAPTSGSTPQSEIVVTGQRIAKAVGRRVLRTLLKPIDLFWSSPACCFTAGTLVSTPTGLKPIEELNVGDLVISRSDETGETAAKPITQIIPAHERRIWTITVSYQGGDGRWRDETYETTDDHPWRTADGQWLTSASLKTGQVLAREEGSAIVAEIRDTGTTKLTYNLEIADFHTYFVGQAEVWVHNECDADSGDFWKPVEETLARIARGERFPHRNDGSVFRNDKGFIPRHPLGYYREYVVPTPGVSGPGAQRLVIGQGGEIYFTQTHYRSFIRYR